MNKIRKLIGRIFCILFGYIGIHRLVIGNYKTFFLIFFGYLIYSYIIFETNFINIKADDEMLMIPIFIFWLIENIRYNKLYDYYVTQKSKNTINKLNYSNNLQDTISNEDCKIYDINSCTENIFFDKDYLDNKQIKKILDFRSIQKITNFDQLIKYADIKPHQYIKLLVDFTIINNSNHSETPLRKLDF